MEQIHLSFSAPGGCLNRAPNTSGKNVQDELRRCEGPMLVLKSKMGQVNVGNMFEIRVGGLSEMKSDHGRTS
jgi:hypothetical protein